MSEFDNHLPSSLIDVRRSFVSELLVFGVSGAERLVAGYAIEAAMLDEIAKSADALGDRDMVEIVPNADLSDMVEIITMIDEIIEDRTLAMKRYAFAVELLEQAKKEYDA